MPMSKVWDIPEAGAKGTVCVIRLKSQCPCLGVLVTFASQPCP